MARLNIPDEFIQDFIKSGQGLWLAMLPSSAAPGDAAMPVSIKPPAPGRYVNVCAVPGGA